MDIPLGGDIGVESLHLLCVGERRQGDDIADLRLPAGEHRGAVDSRNQADFCSQRADLCQQTSVRALVILQNHLPDGLLLVLIDRIAELGEIRIVPLERCFHSLCNLGNSLLSRLLVVREAGLLHFLRRDDLLHILEHLIRHGDRGIFLLRLAGLRHDSIDEGNDLLVDRISLIDIADHVLLRDLVCSRLNHDDLVRGRGHCQAQIPLIPLLLAGVDDHLPVHKTDLRGRAGAGERNIRNRGSDRGTNHRHELRSACRIHAHHHTLERDIVAHILRKQRAHRAVDHAARQNRILAGLALSLVESSREFANGIELFRVLHTQREEIHALARLCRLGRRAKHRGVPIVHECTAICLFSDPADINRQLPAGKIHGIRLIHLSFISSSSLCFVSSSINR